ncbi:MAG: YjbH domain-containing protein [Bacteroidetes bacterium]|nr:YjbH domain-containing protein [Bacteroidota bacterium]
MCFLHPLKLLVFVASIIWCLPLPINGQSSSGIPGYIRIPTATLNRDGTFYIGTSFLPKQHLEYTFFQYDVATAFVSLTFLPFVEVDFRFTRQLNLPSYSNHVSDRMPSIRVRLFKERKWMPSIVVGVHDFLTSIESGDARHFQSSYLVITKGLFIPPAELTVEATMGFGADWLVSRNYELTGFFGGICLNWKKVKWINLMADYDSEVISLGLEAICFSHLFIKGGIVNFDSFTGCISYYIFLKK